MPHFTNIRSITTEIWRLIVFQDGGRSGAILLPYRTGWRHFLQKVSVYQQTKYRQDNSIHDREVIISVLQKQTFAVLKFFFRFRLWLHHRNPDDILQKVAKLHPYRTTQFRNVTSYRFSRCQTRPLNTTSGFVFVDVTAFRKSKSISKPNFVDMIDSRLRHDYLCFWKINVRHYRNSTSGFNLDHIAVICMLFCIRLPELVTTAFISCYPLSRVYLCSSGTLNAYMSFQSVTITFTNVLLFYVISFSVLIDCLLIYCVVFIVLLFSVLFSITFWWRLSVSY